MSVSSPSLLYLTLVSSDLAFAAVGYRRSEGSGNSVMGLEFFLSDINNSHVRAIRGKKNKESQGFYRDLQVQIFLDQVTPRGVIIRIERDFPDALHARACDVIPFVKGKRKIGGWERGGWEKRSRKGKRFAKLWN